MLKRFDKKTLGILLAALVLIVAFAFVGAKLLGDNVPGFESDIKENEQSLMDFADENGYVYNDEGIVSYGNGTNVFTFGNKDVSIELSAFMQTNGKPEWNQVNVTCSGKDPVKVMDAFIKAAPDAMCAYETVGSSIDSGQVLDAVADREGEMRKTIEGYGKKNVEDKNWDYENGYLAVKYRDGLYYAGMVFAAKFNK